MVNKFKVPRSSSSKEAKPKSKGKHKADYLAGFPRSESFIQNVSEALKALIISKQSDNQGPEDEWNDQMVLGLEKLLLKDLGFAYRGAIKKVVKLGYTEEETQFSVFNIWNSFEFSETTSESDIPESIFGSEDFKSHTVENVFELVRDIETLIVEGAVDDLKDKKEFNTQEPPIFKDLSCVVSHFMLLMVNTLRKMKSDLSVAEAIWCLFISESNFLLLLYAAEFNWPFEEVIVDYNNFTGTGGNPSCSSSAGSATKSEMPKQKSLQLFEKDKKDRKHNNCVSKRIVNTPIKTLNSAEKTLASLDAMLKVIEGRYGKITYDKAPKKHAALDEQDIILIVLYNILTELEKEKANWTIWASEKVNQVSGRLRKDEKELKKLKADKDKAKKANELKRIMVWEGLLTNIKGRAEVAETVTATIEEENKELKKSLKDIKSEAEAICETIKESEIKEQDLLKRLQNEEKNNNSFLEELKKLKAHREGIESNLKKEKAFLKQQEGRVAETLKSVEHIRSEKDQIIDAAKKHNEAALKKEEDYEKIVKEKIKRLQTDICEGKMKLVAEKVRGMYAVSDETYEEMNENECVMCLNDEKSVVFLPCAHQVVCVKCNDLHQKHGMKDCPACRTTIARRISAIFIHSQLKKIVYVIYIYSMSCTYHRAYNVE